jgi:hypothetical protein
MVVLTETKITVPCSLVACYRVGLGESFPRKEGEIGEKEKREDSGRVSLFY